MRAMKRLANIDIAKPRDDPLVEQQGLDGGASAPKLLVQAVHIELRRLRPHLSDGAPSLHFSGRDEVDGSEAPRVVESNAPALVRFHQQMIVHKYLVGVDPPLSRHAEVEHQRVSPIGRDQSELSAPSEPRDRRSRQPLAKIGWERSAQIRSAQLHPGNPPAEKHFLEPTDGGFDFGKLWHHGDMAKLAAAS